MAIQQDLITVRELAEDLQVSTQTIFKRLEKHPEWPRETVKRGSEDTPKQLLAMQLPSRALTPEQAEVIRREIIEAKRSRRGAWAHPLPKETPIKRDDSPQPQAMDILVEMNAKLDRLLKTWNA